MDNELSFDALVRPRHLDNLYWFAESYRELPIVIDHAGKPDIASGELEPWRTSMRALASLPNVYCKLSGLVTEARPGWEPSDLQPYVKCVIEYFGSQRTMWGSDWPVVNLASNYSAWLETARTLTAALKRADLDAIFGGTASRFYNLKV
jgi:L-fuconolactonase